MAQTQKNPQPEQKGPEFAIQRLYVKDLSLETPNTPAIFLEQWQHHSQQKQSKYELLVSHIKEKLSR